MIKVFIDPGHGGKDPGAVGNGLQEKDVVLDIAKRISKMLEQYEGVQVKLSRKDDRFIELSERARMANAWGADYFVSVHINAGGGIGFETFIYTSRSAGSINAQTVVHSEIFKEIGGTDRGKKSANLSVLRNTSMLAILTETLFIDSTSDAAKLKDTTFLKKAAQGHVNGIAKAFSLQKKKGGSAKVIRTDANIKFEGKKVDGFVEDGRTYVQVRDLAEMLGLNVGWDQGSKTVTLNK